MRRLPITVRLTLVFAAAMAAVLVATGLFLYVRLGSELDRTVEDGLKARASDVAALVRRSRGGPADARHDRLTDADESFAQVIDPRGTVVGGTPEVGDDSLLAPEELKSALERPIFLDRTSVTGKLDGDPGRLLATPLDAGDRRLVVVVGASTDERDEALHSLAKQLLLGGPIALLLASLTAFGVARAALRPVDLMRRQAGAISGAEPGRRLPVPGTRDELSRLGETLNAMLARLEAALARERNFVSDASHELRTPLAILKTEFELALREGRSRQELHDAVRSAAQETDRLVQLAEDLLVIARSDQGRLPVTPEALGVDEVLAGVRRRFARRAEEVGRQLEAEPSPGLKVFADRLRLEQAVGNMVDNALRHGGGRILLTARAAAERVELHVTDEGGGFPPEFIDRAFERFSRADQARARGGTGLGLSVVQGIAVAHGGSAHAANRPAGGADVWLSLPAGVPTTDAQPAPRRESAPSAAATLSARAPAASGAWARLVLVVGAVAVAGAATFAIVAGSAGKSQAPRVAASGDVHDGSPALMAAAETQPVPHDGDAADDPAIWVNRREPARSAVIGTDKDGGIAVYDLAGRQLQYLPAGKLNNVDLRTEFRVGGQRITLVAASNRSEDTIALYELDARTRRLSARGTIPAGIKVYGLCMYRSRRTGAIHVFVDGKSGGVEQWQLVPRGRAVTGRLVRRFDVGSDVEGCVADDALGRLYVSEEEHGIWRYGAEPRAGRARELVDSTGARGHLVADVEGLAIVSGAGRRGFLIASSQGDSTFVAYRRAGANAFVRKFAIRAGRQADGVEDTDGIDVTSAPLGAAFPHGLLVAQDGSNDNGNQNFKLVRWRLPA
jgi:myo-inositol-hexaphosphate 3-phosphohydrolase/signal transduction histidine kinase